MTATLHELFPDAELINVCRLLTSMQAQWQRLYDATSAEEELATTADHAWRAYSDDVWPAVHSQSFAAAPGTIDIPARLLALPATTPEGLCAKASAILAIDDAGAWCDGRDDSYELMRSVLLDLAGSG